MCVPVVHVNMSRCRFDDAFDGQLGLCRLFLPEGFQTLMKFEKKPFIPQQHGLSEGLPNLIILDFGKDLPVYPPAILDVIPVFRRQIPFHMGCGRIFEWGGSRLLDGLYKSRRKIISDISGEPIGKWVKCFSLQACNFLNIIGLVQVGESFHPLGSIVTPRA